MGSRKISWKRMWRNYCLFYNNTRLVEVEKPLSEYGVTSNGAVISFARYMVNVGTRKSDAATS